MLFRPAGMLHAGINRAANNHMMGDLQTKRDMMDYYITTTYNIPWLGDISTRKERHGNTITRLGRLQQTERVGGKGEAAQRSNGGG